MAIKCEGLMFELENGEKLRLTMDEAKEMFKVLEYLFAKKEQTVYPNLYPGIFDDTPPNKLLYPYTDTISTENKQPTIPPVGKYARRKKDKCAC